MVAGKIFDFAKLDTLEGGQMKFCFQRETVYDAVMKRYSALGEPHPPTRCNVSSQSTVLCSPRETASLPFSQWLPVNPEGQTHLLGAMHVPPYLQPSSQNAVTRKTRDFS